VSRALSTSQILLDIVRYERERLSDLPPVGLLLVNNLTQNQWEDLEKRYDVRQRQQDNRTWRDIMVAFGINPTLPVQAELLSFSNLPEHFDKRTATEMAIYAFALAFRIDPREIWPVSAGTLGTATEANIQHLKARAKGPGLIMTDIERIFNSGNTIAPSLTFQFDFQDAEEDLQAAAVANAKADFITKLTGGNLLDPEEARAWLVKEGLFDEADLMAFNAEEQATDVEEAKSLLALDMGPRTRVFSDPNKTPIRLEKRAQLWRGFSAKGGEGSGHHGHEGRPGEVGGSLPSDTTAGTAAEGRSTKQYTPEQLQAIKDLGNEWHRGDLHRVYINEGLGRFYGIETSRYGSGNISSATLDGVAISNSEAKRLLSQIAYSKFWFDLTTEKFSARGEMSSEMFKKIVANIKKEVRRASSKTGLVDIDEFEGSEDWILTDEVRAEEIAISQKLAEQHAKSKAVTEEGKVETTGKPLPRWPEGEPVPITAEDVARAMRKWDRKMPKEFRGLLMAEPEEAILPPEDLRL
jgi:hypothetical protein